MSVIKTTAVLPLALLVMLCVSCVTTSQVAPQAANDRLSAEYSQMKMRLPLLERENEVLKEESLQYRLKVRKLDAGTQQLSSDLARLNKQHQEAIELVQTQTQRLQEQLGQQQQASAEAIEALNKLNHGLAEQLSEEARGFNEKMAAQKIAFNQQVESAQQENAKKQGDLYSHIDVLEKTLASRDAEIDALKKKLTEFSAGLTATGKEISQLDQQRAELQKDLSSRIGELEKTVAARNTEIDALKQKNNELTSRLDAAGKEMAQISRSRAGLEKELESVKAAENELLGQLKKLSDEFNKKNIVLK